MPSLGTNVLVRYLDKDDARQHAAAAKVIEPDTQGADFTSPTTVALEFEWVIRSHYGVDNEGILDSEIYTGH